MASHEQLEVLVDFLEWNPMIAKGLLRTSTGKAETNKKWHDISRTLNSIGGFKKDGDGWLKYWQEKKKELKRILRNGTIGGPSNSVQFTHIDERMISLLDWQSFSTGESGLAFNQFPAPEAVESFPAHFLQQNMSTSPPSDADTVVLVDVETERYPSKTVERAANIGHTSSTSQSERNAVRDRTDRSHKRRAPSPPSHSQRRRQAGGSAHQRMADIKARRVDAEVIGRALESMARSLERVAAAITNLSSTCT